MGRGVAVKPFQLLRHIEQRSDDRLLLHLLGKARLALDRLGERHRIGGVLRHHLAEPVDLAIRHLQHAADVAQHGARLQRPEGDDLRHLIAAVFALHVADHLVAAILAEVDVEVGHRHAVGIEEALEQQREAQRVDVGDGQRIGDQRAGARATARPDRNAMRLRPFDEVGHDQEVAGELHALDNAELELKPLAILLLGVAFGQPDRLEAHRQAFACLPAQFLHLGLLGIVARAGEARQDRRALLRIVGAAHGDLDGVVDRLRQVGEQHRHFGLALQVIVGRQPPAVVGGNHRALGDGDQRVMRVEIVARRKERLVGGDQRQFVAISEIDRRRLDAPVPIADALQLDIEPVAEDRLQLEQPAFGEIGVVEFQRHAHRAARAAGEADQPRRQLLQPGRSKRGSPRLRGLSR